jgi:tRNA G18 (ribose-2'-O)-methylase SpoU
MWTIKQGLALFMGSESDGLSAYWLDKATNKIRIPMAGQADSLNVPPQQQFVYMKLGGSELK